MLDIILRKSPNSCKVYNFTLTTSCIKKTEGRGGNNFRLLRQACQTLPKAIAAPPLLTASLTLTLGYNTPLYAVSPWKLMMFSVAFDKLVYGEGKYYQLPRAPCWRNVRKKLSPVADNAFPSR